MKNYQKNHLMQIVLFYFIIKSLFISYLLLRIIQIIHILKKKIRYKN